MEPPRIFKKNQASKLGDAQGIPTLHQQASGRFVETMFLSLYILCALFGASFCFQFFFCLLVISLLDPCFICVGERHAPFSFEYSFASLISC